ncbi:MAG: amidase [Candidatus Tectomicrobia bacterium]|uniref:Amidase n=1 Tax=Tectimicrobiota bacterium TaxID=2528274 RepID=A0A933GMB0_UNCTE|nr:amidase [Candidatus Tectomicrobia bacterium]
MTAFPEFHKYDSLTLAEMVRTKQVTALQLVEEAISRIEARNPNLNAVIYKMYDQAHSTAKGDLPDCLFKGVPFLLKDLIATYEGIPTGCGNRLMKNIPMPHDSEIVRRFKAAGVIILGKTNTPEFGLLPITEPELFGVTRNPWDLNRTPGGSSGGSAAAVAARMVPLADGGDGGGSIRIPASCCGLFGLKPTRGRTPTGPDLGELWHGFTQEHVISRSVRDSAAMLDAIAGPDVGAPYFAPLQVRPFLQEVTTAPGCLRIAFTSHPFLGRTVHDDCQRGLESTVRLLQQLGHEVIEAAPHIDGEEFSIAFLTIVAAETRATIEWASDLAKRKIAMANFEGSTYVLGLLGKTLSASSYSKASNYLQMTAREVGRFFEQYDVLLTPTLSKPPLLIGELKPSGAESAMIKLIGYLNAGWLLNVLGLIKPMAQQAFDFIPYTPVFNVTGQPAMSVPLYWNEAGLPIGMHFVGRFGDEATLFRLAGQLERAQSWFDRAPADFF